MMQNHLLANVILRVYHQWARPNHLQYDLSGEPLYLRRGSTRTLPIT